MMRRPRPFAAPAPHPFRGTLPPAALAVAPDLPDEDKDWKLFLLSFSAFFTCFYTFIF